MRMRHSDDTKKHHDTRATAPASPHHNMRHEPDTATIQSSAPRGIAQPRTTGPHVTAATVRRDGGWAVESRDLDYLGRLGRCGLDSRGLGCFDLRVLDWSGLRGRQCLSFAPTSAGLRLTGVRRWDWMGCAAEMGRASAAEIDWAAPLGC